MNDGMERPTGPNSDGEGSGVLGNLPRTRPQRATPRRAAARRSAGEKSGAASTPARSADGGGNGNGARRSASPPAAEVSAGAASETGTARKADARADKGQRGSRNRAGKRTAGPARRQQRSATKLEAVPAQGYETEDDAATGAVRPPGGAELVLSAAEIVGELAKAGLSRSERLIKDVLSHLPLS